MDLDVESGSVIGIVGPNGSGKSTLIKILAGIIEPQEGKVEIDGQPLSAMRRKAIARLISVVPQQTVFHFPFSVFDFVMMGRHPYQSMTPFESTEDHRIVKEALEQTGILHLAQRSVLELSGGEKQRTVLASALAQHTQLMLLDEPTASLDLRYQVQIHKALVRLSKEQGLTVVVVTHDLNLGALFCERMLLMKEGRIVADGPPVSVCDPQVIQEHYGVQVIGGINEATNSPFILPTGK